MEDKKKSVQKKVGEIRVILATLPLNQRTEAWLPIAGEKNKTVGDVRLRLHYSVDVLLPSAQYNPFLEVPLRFRRHILMGEFPNMAFSSFSRL